MNWYSFTRWFFRHWWRLCYGYKVTGWENVPARGACVVVSNHISNMDPGAIGTAIPHRQVHFMAKKELFEKPFSRTLMRWWGAFPVDRGHADRKSMKKALELLQQGKVIGLFPEGTRSHDDRMGEWHVGMAMLANRGHAPIVPAALINTRSTLEERRARPGGPPVHVRFGAPIPVPAEQLGREELEALKERARQAVEAMLSEMLVPESPGGSLWPSGPKAR